MIKEAILNRVNINKPQYYFSLGIMILIGYIHIWPDLIQFSFNRTQLEHYWILASIPYFALSMIIFAAMYITIAGIPIYFRNRLEAFLIYLISPFILFGILSFLEFIGLKYSLIILLLVFIILIIERIQINNLAVDDEEE